MKKKLSKKKVSIISSALLSVFIVGGVIFANANKTEEFVEPLREYPVSRGDIVAGLTGAGQLKLQTEEYNFSNPVTIGEILVEEGQEVKVGDKLVTLSDTQLNEQLSELEDQLTKAKLSLQQATNNKELTVLNNEKSWKQTVQTTQQQYSNEKSALETEVIKLEQELSTVTNQINQVQEEINNIASNQQNETEEQTVDEEQLTQLNEQLVLLQEQASTLKSQIETTKGNLNNLNEKRAQELNQEQEEANSNKKINDKTLQDLDSSIQLAQMEVEKVESEISKVNELKENNALVSTVDGIVMEIGYLENTTTTVEKSVVTIGKMDCVNAVLTVSQNDVNKLEEEQIVELEVNAYPGEKLKAKVTSISYTPTNEGGTVVYKVMVELDSSSYRLLEGMTVNAKFILKEVNDVLTLSNKAITLKEGKQLVQVKREDGSIEEIEITTGFSDGRISEITSGLNEGDIVVVGG